MRHARLDLVQSQRRGDQTNAVTLLGELRDSRQLARDLSDGRVAQVWWSRMLPPSRAV